MKNLLSENEAILITSPGNLFYFSDIKNADAYELFVGTDKYYFTDSRYFEDAETKLKGFIIKDIKDFHDFIKKSGIVRLGIEESTLSHSACNDLRENGIKTLYGVDKRISRIRSIKTPTELSYIKKAQEITDKTFTDILPIIKEGITEIELANILESLLFINGADELAFSSIVAFGENASKPHAERTEKKLVSGDIVLMDFGAKYRNYCSDMTRTIFFGKPDDEQVKIYNIVRTAQEMALGVAYAGMTGHECDAMARNYFCENGLEEYFIHSLGHGVGIDIHEHPRLGKDSNTVMEENMVVTVEPGLYFPGKFGVRIEDLIIFDKSSVINLTKSPKNMIII